MKQLWKDSRILFEGFEIVLYLIGLYVLNMSYFYVVSKSLLLASVVGAIGSYFFFKYFFIENRKLQSYQRQLKDLQKYTSNMTFFLKTGKNVLDSLEASMPSVGKEVRKDIDQTIKIMKREAVLSTEHFKKYNFPALEQYHKNLQIKYERGGNADDLFHNVNKRIFFELKKRDELWRKRRGFSVQVYLLLSGVALMPVILRVMTSDLWDIYLHFGWTSYLFLLLIFGAFLVNLGALQRKRNDISIRL